MEPKVIIEKSFYDRFEQMRNDKGLIPFFRPKLALLPSLMPSIYVNGLPIWVSFDTVCLGDKQIWIFNNDNIADTLPTQFIIDLENPDVKRIKLYIKSIDKYKGYLCIDTIG